MPNIYTKFLKQIGQQYPYMGAVFRKWYVVFLISCWFIGFETYNEYQQKFRKIPPPSLEFVFTKTNLPSNFTERKKNYQNNLKTFVKVKEITYPVLFSKINFQNKKDFIANHLMKHSSFYEDLNIENQEFQFMDDSITSFNAKELEILDKLATYLHQRVLIGHSRWSDKMYFILRLDDNYFLSYKVLIPYYNYFSAYLSNDYLESFVEWKNRIERTTKKVDREINQAMHKVKVTKDFSRAFTSRVDSLPLKISQKELEYLKNMEALLWKAEKRFSFIELTPLFTIINLPTPISFVFFEIQEASNISKQLNFFLLAFCKGVLLASILIITIKYCKAFFDRVKIALSEIKEEELMKN